MNLAQLGEESVVSGLTAGLASSKQVVVGPGDDCAVVRQSKGRPYELLKTDSVVEGVHFLRTQPPQKIGWKALARAISDIAAMGGRPKFALVSLASPGEVEMIFWKKLYRGLEEVASRFDVKIVGGETTRIEGPIVLTLMLTGEVEARHLVCRSGGRAGDDLWVTGRLGGSIRGRHLTFMPRVEEATWLVRHFKPTAMMDLSDGIAKDLPRLAARSGVGFSLDEEAIPRNRGCSTAQALGDGEDFELLFSLPRRHGHALQMAWQKKFPRLSLSRIGRLERESVTKLSGGFDHFSG